MRCSNCGAQIFDGTPVCPQCGNVNRTTTSGEVPRVGGTETSRPPLEATDDAMDEDDEGRRGTTELPQPSSGRGGPNRASALRAKMGAPRPAAPPPADDSTVIKREPVSVEETDEPVSRPKPRPAAGRVSGSRPSLKRPGTSGPNKVPSPMARARKPESTDADEDSGVSLSDKPGRRPPADTEDLETAPPARPAPRKSVAPTAKPTAGRPLVQPGKYASVADEREPELTMARPELQQQAPAGAPPPVNPEELLQGIKQLVQQMGFEDKLESFSACGMVLLTFMPWISEKGESSIGLLTGTGFFAMLLACGVLAAVYLRLTGRVPTFTPKMLSLLETIGAAIPIPLILVFIITSFDRRQITYGSQRTYYSAPEFGVFLALLVNLAMCAGAALVMQREKKR